MRLDLELSTDEITSLPFLYPQSVVKNVFSMKAKSVPRATFLENHTVLLIVYKYSKDSQYELRCANSHVTTHVCMKFCNMLFTFCCNKC